MTNKRQLLIVDDEVNVTRTLQMLFEDAGYDVVPAYSCQEALKVLANGHSFDAIITDLNMERPDIGLDVARAAQNLKPKPAVIICTGYASVSNASTALAMHVDYLATKPVDIDELKGTVQRLLRRRSEGERA